MSEMPMLWSAITVAFFVGPIVGCSLLLIFMPRWTRPDIYFSVTVRRDFRDTPEAREIERRYKRQVVVHALIACGIVLCSLLAHEATALNAWLTVGGFIWLLGGWVVLILTRLYYEWKT